MATLSRKSRTVKATEIVATICLYGNHEVGYGWLAHVGAKLVGDGGGPRIGELAANAVSLACMAVGMMLGDGAPRRGTTATESLWNACNAVALALGHCRGLVCVYAPGGRFSGETALGFPGWYGNITWRPAPVFAVKVDEILKHAEGRA